MTIDYSQLLENDELGLFSSWQEVIRLDIPLPRAFLELLPKVILLPQDFYRIIAAYSFIPSALAQIVPYLFLNGVSGSGKSYLAKVISYLHGVKINSSSDTYAAIRNDLEQRKYASITLYDDKANMQGMYRKEVETNTMMVWDDVDAGVFNSKPDIYRLFKFGYDRSSDTIVIASEERGQNMNFRCFCPKVFSSISPLHLDIEFKELARRLIVIPTSRIEYLSDERKQELGIDDGDWSKNLIDVDSIKWKGLSEQLKSYWSLEKGKEFLQCRKNLSKSVKCLKSHEKAISLDLMATGIVTGIWSDTRDALDDMTSYFNWLEQSIKNTGSSLVELIKKVIEAEQNICETSAMTFALNAKSLRRQSADWYEQAWLPEKPKPREVFEIMTDLGYELKSGFWVKK
ncbi:MAG: hypothetical protein Tsb0014_35660 [Pleurocapsa sp.]